MNTDILRWLILCQLNGLALSYCLFGNSSDCAFQCHCAVESECDEGQCPSGCETAPLGYNWAGPACQIGNVGLHKSANMTAEGRYKDSYPAKAALDGVSPGSINSNCSHPFNPTSNTPAEWWADLGDVYKIYNITIYGRTDCCEERLQHFDLTVYNTSDNEVLCAHRDDSIKTQATITCTRPLIGRYVHFKRTGGTEIEQTALCEVVIIGHKYIDCTLCPDGVACNDVTGCEQCRATYQPDCKQACEEGFYGTNCKQRCGRCKDGDKACDKVDGRCLNGCEIWWTDITCNTYVDLPNYNNESVTVTHKTTDSIQIQWQHIRGISADLSDFYGYLIQYKADAVDDNYTEAGIVKYESTASWKIDKLKPGREYWIEIKPFREYEGKKEFGIPYSALKVKTGCGVSMRTNIGVTTVPWHTGLPNILFIWQSLSNSEANCYNITKVSVFYKSTTSSHFTAVVLSPQANSYVIAPGQDGKYEVKLVVEDNEGYQYSSELLEIIINEEDTKSCSLNGRVIGGAYGGMVAIIIIAAVIIIIILIRCRRAVAKEKQREPDRPNIIARVEASNQDVAVLEAGQRRRDYVSQEQRSSELVGYATVKEDKDKNTAERCPSVVQYEEFMTDIKEDRNPYEAPSTERGKTYENFVMKGPYQELKK